MRLRLAAVVSLATLTEPACVVLPLTRVTTAVPLTVLPLPRLMLVVLALSEMLAMLCCASVNSSMLWLMPSWFRSRHRRTCVKAASEALNTLSRLPSSAASA